MAGNWKSEDFWGGLAQDSISLPISDLVPADVKAEAEQIIARIKSGEFHPFTGPIRTRPAKCASPRARPPASGPRLDELRPGRQG